MDLTCAWTAGSFCSKYLMSTRVNNKKVSFCFLRAASRCDRPTEACGPPPGAEEGGGLVAALRLVPLALGGGGGGTMPPPPRCCCCCGGGTIPKEGP
eukprot:scaffold40909_cov160-Amphora_coffeaeformis.AAC.1